MRKSLTRIGLLMVWLAAGSSVAWAQSDTLPERTSGSRWRTEEDTRRETIVTTTRSTTSDDDDDERWGVYFPRKRSDRRYLLSGDVGAFGSFLVEIGQIADGQTGTMTGGGGALIFDDRFFIGGYGQRLVGGLNEVPAQALETHGEGASLEFGHGGFWLGGNIRPEALVHPTWSARLGWGRARWNRPSVGSPVEDRFFLMQPAVGLQLNLLSWMRVSLEGSYRYVTGIDLLGSDSSDFNGFSGNVTFSFGGWD